MTHKITICMGSSCFARGNEKNLQVIQEFIEKNHLDTEIEFKGARCTNQCSRGPNIIIDEIFYNKMDRETLIDLLNRKLIDSEK